MILGAEAGKSESSRATSSDENRESGERFRDIRVSGAASIRVVSRRANSSAINYPLSSDTRDVPGTFSARDEGLVGEAEDRKIRGFLPRKKERARLNAFARALTSMYLRAYMSGATFRDSRKLRR